MTRLQTPTEEPVDNIADELARWIPFLMATMDGYNEERNAPREEDEPSVQEASPSNISFATAQ